MGNLFRCGGTGQLKEVTVNTEIDLIENDTTYVSCKFYELNKVVGIVNIRNRYGQSDLSLEDEIIINGNEIEFRVKDRNNTGGTDTLVITAIGY